MSPAATFCALGLVLCTATYAIPESKTELVSTVYDEFILVNLKFPERQYDSSYDIDIKANGQGHIFIPVKELEDIFYGQLNCQGKSYSCQYKWPQSSKITTLDLSHGKLNVHIDQTKRNLQAGKDYLIDNNQPYLNSTIIDTLFGTHTTLNESTYALTITFDELPIEIRNRVRAEKNRHTLLKQQAEATRRARLAARETIEPTGWFNLEGKYQLQFNQYLKRRTTAPNNQNLVYNLTSDIATGTLQGSGSFRRPRLATGYPYTWNYALRNKPGFDLLQVGDLTSQPSTFAGSTRLHNAIKFDRLQEVNPNFNFEYTDQTLPGTEINVWRGGYLVTVIKVGASGQFTIVDPDAEPGDTFKLVYYFPDGTEQTKSIRYSPNRFLLLNDHQWDLEFVHGTIDNGEGNSLGTYTHSLLRYGLLDKFTIGWGTYTIPLNDTNTERQTLHYLDTAWQALPSLAVDYDRFINASGYTLEGIWTSFPDHTIEAEYRRLDVSNPLLNTPLISGDFNTTRLFTLKDIWSLFPSWRLVSQYENAISADEYKVDLTGSWNSYFSQGYQLNWLKNNDQPYQFSTQLNNTIRITRQHLIQAAVNWTRWSSNIQSLSYTYRSEGTPNWNATVSYNRSKSNGSSVNSNVTGNLFYQFSPHLSASLTVGEKTVLLSINFTDVVGLFTAPSLPSHYATGSIEGHVYAPVKPGEKPKPIAHAKVRVGGIKAETDETGYFYASGIPTHSRINFDVDPSSIDLSYIPEHESVPMYFRPGTLIQYNPVISHNISMDGYVFTDGTLPKNLEVEAIKQDGSVIRYSKVEADGFYIIEKLTPGQYQLKLVGEHNNAPKPLTIDIKPEKDWISDVNLYWYQIGESHTGEKHS